MSGLNESQQKIADTTEGMIVVDAGPGTGKTFTVVSRCINILRKKDFDWHDLVMLTFTKNAAAEMRERLQAAVADMYLKGDIDAKEFDRLDGLAKKITVGTFDSFCLSVVKQSPYMVSRFFRFDEFLTRGANISENESVNERYFARFLDRFLMERGEEFGTWSAIAAGQASEIYSLLNRLMSCGIVPLRKTPEGRFNWFGGNDGDDLKGDLDTLREIMNRFPGLSHPEDYADVPDAANYDLSGKNTTGDMLDDAAFDSRKGLIEMIHEIYYDYIRTAVKEDHLTFGLVACFAFIVLLNDSATRERMSTRYLIVDEFQDTNSNQLMISMLVLKEPNLCVVGDWKQGIYGFRFVSIENITEFEKKVTQFREILNADGNIRIPYKVKEVIKLPLTENYRSSQTVIDAAYETLKIKGTQNDTSIPEGIDGMITPIVSQRKEIGQYTGIECVQCDGKKEEVDEVIRRIDAYVNSGDYMIVDDDKTPPRRPDYSDIAVLCRNGSMCRMVYDACQDKNIPAFMQGDIDIMNTPEARLLLAWLRYVSNDQDPWGVAAILAERNYPAEMIRRMVRPRRGEKREPVPDDIREFRKHLRAKRRRITELISDVYSWYGLDNNITQAITTVLSSAHRGSLQTISNLITAIESDMANQSRYDVDGLPDSNAVIIQTLHKSKGLEYPIVIIPSINSNGFPNVKDSSVFKFSSLTGIRCTKTVIKFGDEMKIGDSWRTAVVSASVAKDYSEERRLFFVGISRAKQYVTLIAGKKPSEFFKHFARGSPQQAGTYEVEKKTLRSQIPEARPVIGEFKVRRKNLSAHDLLMFGMTSSGMRPEGEADELCHKGMKYGTEVHQMAELIVRDFDIEPERFEEYPELVKVKATVERLRAEGAEELYAERRCGLALNDPNVTISGIIDLLAVFPDRIEIHDWKTDAEGDYQGEYRIQLSIYAHVLMDMHPGKKVTCTIDWLDWSEPETFEPLDIEVIKERTKAALGIGEK